MELTLIALTPADPVAVRLPDRRRIVDLLWAAAAPGERLEHVSVQVNPRGIRLGMFAVATPELTARAAALAICRRALATSPPLSGWRIAGEPSLRQDVIRNTTRQEHP
ncbi:hypothetical protein [Streptomyces kaniharaensis]|uniref:hypothetical protein n=1 Tax=Streptomyces kaniharaensis TaxID=212423 RepID=UPI001E4130B3|nr:hypothetical protein [Streptomyces kaniharaensis]